MKKIIFISILLMGFLATTFAQKTLTITPTQEINNSSVLGYYFTGTINNDTTLYLTVPGSLENQWAYSVQLVADSVSGATAGTVTLLQSNSVNGTVYTSTATQTMDGVLTDKIWESSTGWLAPKMRLTAAGTGTMSTTVRVWVYFIK